MSKNDIVQTETSGDTVASLRRELDPKIDGKVPIWALVLVVTILISLAGIFFNSLNNQVAFLNDKVSQLDKSIAITNQKLEDSHPHR